ncbi:B3 domain-containing protein REM-like 3 [Salvia splendens]|uniref:B3 domain-containing protein REM-like 3 n=1 Tax=Salvia splendens TaxID=180675 RepID=UPI001C2683CA|nr:B3 domain-containing protein REM-like 3 [Salvia splendens]
MARVCSSACSTISPEITDKIWKHENHLLLCIHLQNLPPATCKEIQKLKSRIAFLGIWKVSLCRGNNGGWPQFVERHALSLGEFVFFEHTADLHFKVTAYKTNFCENLFQIPLKKCKTEEEESVCFEKKMIPSHGRVGAKVYIPEEFRRQNDLGRRCGKVVLVDPIGREWEVKLGRNSERGRWRMGRGWRGFYDSMTEIFVFSRFLTPTAAAAAAFFNVDIVRV